MASFRAYGLAVESGVPMPLKSARQIAKQTVDGFVNSKRHLDHQAKEFWLSHADYWASKNASGEPGRRELECRSMAKAFQIA